MEQITLDLQPEPATQRMRLVQRTLFVLMGVGNIVQGIMHDNNFRYFNFIIGISVVVIALNYRRIFKPKLFTFDEDGFEGPIGRSDSTRLHWGDISHIEAKMFTLKIFPKSGGERNIYLGNITFNQHKQIKPKILELAQSKGVEVRAA
ncbi:MAG: hypothetical protein HY088_04685 [Ignavibacteriales bacterium]|nr:hypothetical protein [Ignavibacteriales bacterium]